MAPEKNRFAFVLSVVLLISVSFLTVAWVPSLPERSALWPEEPAFTIAPDTLLVFEPHGTDAEPLFVSRGPGYSLLVGPDRMLMNIPGRKAQAGHAVEMTIVDADNQAKGEALDPLTSKTNYLIGNDRSQWRTDVPNFGRVRFDDVYPGIDLVYYDSRRGARPSGHKNLEYDFVVAPGADPSIIRLGFAGVDDLSIDSNGDLVMGTPVGPLRHGKPFVYQQIAGVTTQVGGRYVLDQERLLSFDLGSYDLDHPLIIDPTLGSTFFGGDGADTGEAVVGDKDGNFYLFGTAFGDHPTTSGSLDTMRNGASDCFATKVGGNGEIFFSTLVGGNASDECTAGAVDSHGNTAMTGFSNSTNYPQSHGSPAVPAGFNSFLTILNPEGNDLQFSRLTGGDGGEDGLAIDLVEMDLTSSEPLVAVAITGRTFSNDLDVTPDALMDEHGGGSSDAFGEVIVFDQDPITGELTPRDRSATYLGGLGEDSGGGIEIVDMFREGNNLRVRALCGMTTSTPGLPSCCGDLSGGSDAYGGFYDFNLRFDQTVGAPWSTLVEDSRYIGGEGNDRYEGDHWQIKRWTAAVSTNSTDLDTMPDAVSPTYPGGAESWHVSWYSLSDPRRKGGGPSEFLGATYLGTSGTDTAKSVLIDRNGCVVVAGSTTSPNFPVTDNAPQTEYGGGATDAVVTRICDDGRRIDMSTYLGGPGADVANSIAIDPLDQLIVAGTAGPGFPTSPGTPQPEFGGGASDAFGAVINQTFVSLNGLVSSAKFSQAEGGGISPQEIVSEFGVLVGPEVGVGLMFDQNGDVLREIGGTQALVNGEAAPMVLASQFVSIFVAPADLLSAKGAAVNTATVQFVVDGDPSNTATVPVAPANPGLYTANSAGTGQGAILNPDFSVNGPDNPVPADGFFSLFGTGGGVVDPPCPDGGVGPSAEPLPRLQLPVRVLVDGVDAQVLFAGSAPQLVCGANQYSAIPTNDPSGPAVQVQVCVEDACSNVVTAAFE
jgi:uncharacterized protein (TIGR03437 family)